MMVEMSEENISLLANTLAMRLTYKELMEGRTSDGDVIYIKSFKDLPLGDVIHLFEYFFKNGIFLGSPKAKSQFSYSQIALRQSTYKSLKSILDRTPELEQYEPHLLLILGYASNSALGQVKKTQAKKSMDVNSSFSKDFPNDYNHLLRAQTDFENIVTLFKFLNETYPNPVSNPKWESEGLPPERFPVYLLDEVSIKLTSNQPNTKSKSFTFRPLPKSGLNLFETVFERFIEFTKNEKKSVEDLYREMYRSFLPLLDRPKNLHYAFCQQFFKFFDEQTNFSTNKGFSKNEILWLFVDIYELAGYSFSKSSEYSKPVDLVGNWLNKPIH